MRITKQYLSRLIKEEFDKVMRLDEDDDLGPVSETFIGDVESGIASGYNSPEKLRVALRNAEGIRDEDDNEVLPGPALSGLMDGEGKEIKFPGDLEELEGVISGLIYLIDNYK